VLLRTNEIAHVNAQSARNALEPVDGWADPGMLAFADGEIPERSALEMTPAQARAAVYGESDI
jgi:hypothetical protein